MRNKYIKRSHLSGGRFRTLIRLFALDLEATKIASLSGISRTTVNRYLQLIRTRIAERCEAASPFQGEVEVGESYFGPRRVRGGIADGLKVNTTPNRVLSLATTGFLLLHRLKLAPSQATKLIPLEITL